MAITEQKFDNEAELQAWAQGNIATFLGPCAYLKGFMVRTSSGKGCVPDGFAFDFAQKEWYIVEYELLEHGVWPHIAEQVTRFVVALQNPASLREVRNQLFEHILATDRVNTTAGELGVPPERLLQQIELFIEGVLPTVVVIINDTNQDLTDFAHALDAPTQVFRVRKFLVIRDILGPSPFRPTAPDPGWLAWNDGTVAKMADMIHREQRFSDLPLLADALEDAGCTVADILNHCRSKGEHVRGCWVVDLLLEKQ